MNFHLQNRPNEAAPAYDPEIWNKEAELESAVNSFYKDLSKKRPKRATLKTVIFCTDMLQRAPSEFSKAMAAKDLCIPPDALAVLDQACRPHLLTRTTKNCYAYARDMLSADYQEEYNRPGEIGGAAFCNSGNYDSYAGYKSKLIAACIIDGLKYEGHNPRRLKDHYLIAVYIGYDAMTLKKDFHFVREDNDGLFSHKAGSTKVCRLDHQKNPITDPAKASFGLMGQYSFEGYFQAPSVNI